MDASEKPRPEPAAEATPRDDVVVGASRCPFCHEQVDPAAGPWVACSACLGRHHTACWGEAGRCAACGAATHLQPPPPRSPGRAGVLALVLAAVLLGPLLFIGLAAVVGGEGSTPTAPAAPDAPAAPPPRAPAAPAAPPRAAQPPDLVDEAQQRADVARARALQADGVDAAEALRLAALERRLQRDAPPVSILSSESDFLVIDGAERAEAIARSMIASSDFGDDAGRGCMVAYGYLLLDDPGACVAVANRVLDLVPWYSVAWSLRARAEARLGAWERAQSDAARSAALVRSGNGHDRLWADLAEADASEAAGDRSRAAEALRRVLASPRVHRAGRAEVVAALQARLTGLEGAR